MQPYQPYGQQMMAPPPMGGAVRKMHKTFGITYIAVRSILCGLVILVVLFAASVLAGEMGGDVGAIVGLVALIFLVWLGYAIAGGILGIKGHIAGPIMGLVDTGLSSLLFLATLIEDGNIEGTMCWVMPNILITVFAILALKERQQSGQPGHPQPVGYANQQHGGYSSQQYPQQGGYNNPQYGNQYGAPLQTPTRPQPLQGGTSASVPSPKQAALGILALAAAVDPDLTQEALPRARAVAAKLLGPAAQARIQRQLAQPATVMDVEQDLWQHVSILNQQGNPQMKGNVVKAAHYVLKGPNGVEPMGEQFIATLKQQLGI